MIAQYLQYLILAIPTALLAISLYYNFKFAKIILKIEDAIEDSLDVFDKRYESMSKILETPIFFDSLEVRQVVSDISVSRDAVLYVANLLASFGDSKVERD
tara:strand:- start:1119 stop:1421 length:303 start_codon:yes stop_codon:yes gene_type:complete